MPSVRLNWMRALALVAMAAPAVAGAPSRREQPQRAPASSVQPSLQSTSPQLAAWSLAGAPRVLRGLPETRQVRGPVAVALRNSGAVVLLDVEPQPAETRRPQGFQALLDIDEDPAGPIQRRVHRLPVLLAEQSDVEIAAPQADR